MTREEETVEIGKEAVKQALVPFQEIIREVAGPAATEVGLMWGDSLRVWRLKRAVRLWEDVKKLASAAHLELKPVAPRLLFPILDSATLNEDEDLHARWVALLANAATTENQVLPAFADILKQLTPEEARLLDDTYSLLTTDEKWRNDQLWGGLGPIGLSRPDVNAIAIENLERLGLTRWTTVSKTEDSESGHVYITQLGEAFVLACRSPK